MRKITLVFLLISAFFSLNVKNVLAAGIAKIGTAEIYQERADKKCNFFNSCVQGGEDLNIKLSDIAYSNGTPFPDGEKVGIFLDSTKKTCLDYPYQDSLPIIHYLEIEVVNGSIETTVPGKNIDTNCSYKLTVRLPKNAGDVEDTEKSKKVYPASPVAVLQCDRSEEQCNTNLSVVASYDLCKQQIKEGTDQFDACKACADKPGVWTAVGCIPNDPESVIKTVITIGLAAGGGIVLIMILVGSFMLSVSQGDPNKTKEAKEIITSAIIGLLFVIFSVTILQFIGVSILHIPGFGE